MHITFQRTTIKDVPVCLSGDRQELIVNMLGVADFRFDYRKVPYHLTYLGRNDGCVMSLCLSASLFSHRLFPPDHPCPSKPPTPLFPNALVPF